MKLYHGSPKDLKVLKPQQARGTNEFENTRSIFLTKTFQNAALYSLGKTLKGKTAFALPPNKLLVVGNYTPLSEGYVYEVNVDATKGIWNQYSYDKTIKVFKKTKIKLEDYKDRIHHVKNKEELFKECLREKKKWLNLQGYSIPRLKFLESKPNHYLNTILRFLMPRAGEWAWENKILNEYPSLKKNLLKSKNSYEKEEIIKKYFSDVHCSKNKEIKNKKRSFQREWNKTEDRFMLELFETIGIFFPKNIRTIKAHITLIPICPRNLKDYSFDIYCNFKISQMKAVCMHEIFHFLYFKKYKEVFSKRTQKCEYKLGLHLSEIVPSVVLNTEKFQQIMKYKHKTYEEYKRIKINGICLVDNVASMFERRRNFEDFLIKTDTFFSKNKQKIEKALKD